jgi:hypothetical protein
LARDLEVEPQLEEKDVRGHHVDCRSCVSIPIADGPRRLWLPLS